MPKWFNNAGPCQTDIHYMLSPLARMPELTQLIGQRGDFIIHAPRQMGKTTAMLTLAQQLTSRGWLVIFDRRPELPPDRGEDDD